MCSGNGHSSALSAKLTEEEEEMSYKGTYDDIEIKALKITLVVHLLDLYENLPQYDLMALILSIKISQACRLQYEYQKYFLNRGCLYLYDKQCWLKFN